MHLTAFNLVYSQIIRLHTPNRFLTLVKPGNLKSYHMVVKVVIGVTRNESRLHLTYPIEVKAGKSSHFVLSLNASGLRP